MPFSTSSDHEQETSPVKIYERQEADSAWVQVFLQKHWGGTKMIVHGEEIDLLQTTALIAAPTPGLLTYRYLGKRIEILSIDTTHGKKGVGTALLMALIQNARLAKIEAIDVTTTNDNLTALRFYQRKGFKLSALRVAAVDKARLLKPSIPLVSDNGIPIRDELDLVLSLHMPLDEP